MNFNDKVRAKKHLGQHFLKDLSIARRIVDSVGGGAVLEVGPGMGVLTQFLLQRNDIDLKVIEVDTESVTYLRAHYPDLRIIEGDFLRLDLHDFCQKGPDARLAKEPNEEHTKSYVTNSAPSVTQQAGVFHENIKIIGNFPYNISSQIFFKVLEFRNLVPEVVGMVQREVGVRIAEPPGSRDYGILSVLLQAWYDIEYLFTVSEGVFDPPPKVKSAVIRLRRNNVQSLDCDEKLFVRVVKAAFGQRRKMLRNALRAVFDLPADAEHRFLTMRAEQLGVQDFIELTQWIAEKS